MSIASLPFPPLPCLLPFTPLCVLPGKHLMDFSKGQPYPNKKKIEEYDQCKGGKDCSIGIAHPPNGEEFGLGCTLCAEEALESMA